MITPEAILSDADGTLVNTLHLIRHGQYETSRSYLTQHGIPAEEIPDYDSYEVLLNQSVGGSARDTLERTVRLLYANSQHHLAGINFDELHDMLNPIQDEIAPEFVRGYEGLSSLFGQIGKSGIKLAIFTSGTPHHIVRNFGVSLPELGLMGLFKDKSQDDVTKLRVFEDAVSKHFDIPDFTVVTCDDTNTHKPDPASLNIAMKRLGVDPVHSLVLGDHTVDMQAGINARVAQRVGITHGFEGGDVLQAAGATSLVSSLPELVSALTA